MTSEAQSDLPEGKRPAFHRRRYIVDQPFQYRLIGTLISIWLANSLFFTAVLYFFYEGHLRHFYDLVPRGGALPLVSLPTLFALAIGFVFVFGLVVLGIIVLYMSNQIAGPLHRTKKCLHQVGEGDWSFRLQFRQRDFLLDLAGIINTMVDGLKAQAGTEVEELRAIESAKDDPALLKRLVRKHRMRKEAQLGLATGAGQGRDPQQVSMAVH